MFQPESRIIYISSVRARQPWAEQLMYAAGKSAGESLCRTWSMAFGGRDDRVCLFFPFQFHDLYKNLIKLPKPSHHILNPPYLFT